jgi:hypothetical protein
MAAQKMVGKVAPRTAAMSGPKTWSVQNVGGVPHAINASGKDLGELAGGANGTSVVQSTAGGRAWNMYRVLPNGTTQFLGMHAGVPGHRLPPNAGKK